MLQLTETPKPLLRALEGNQTTLLPTFTFLSPEPNISPHGPTGQRVRRTSTLVLPLGKGSAYPRRPSRTNNLQHVK